MLVIYPVVLQFAPSQLATFNIVRPLVHCFEEVGVVGIKSCKYLPNHPIADGVTVLAEMRTAMVISANGYHVANVIQSPAVQWDNMMCFEVKPTARGPETLFAAKLAASSDRPAFHRLHDFRVAFKNCCT